jgi:glycosyltransferase involved in cell wall biosynthesis
MSAGLPVVATNVGGIREYGVDRTNILTLPEADPGRVVATLMR